MDTYIHATEIPSSFSPRFPFCLPPIFTDLSSSSSSSSFSSLCVHLSVLLIIMAQQGLHAADTMQGYGRQDVFALQTSMEMLGFPPKEAHYEHQERIGQSSQYYDGFEEAADWEQQAFNATVKGYGDEPLMTAVRANQLSLSLFDTSPRDSEVPMHGQFINPQPPYQELRRSKYLVPAQEVLSEFCSIQSSSDEWRMKKSKAQWDEGTATSSSSSWNHSLQSVDVLELQRRKARLIFMLEEVDRRYRRYCEQMRSVVAGFELVVGEGAAAVYVALAGKAMSRHFRCLRDGIVGQVRATTKAIGEKDGTGAPGASHGETPRLRVIDQCLRQQKLLQQGGLMESHPWRPQRGLPERSVSILRAWLFEHFLHPYPSDVDKHILARQTGLTRSQVSNWFINARVRLWKPMVEEMYLEETKEHENHSSATSSCHQDFLMTGTNSNPNFHPTMALEDQKPDSDSLSSIVIGATTLDVRNVAGGIPSHQRHQLVDIDFASYSASGHPQGFTNSVSLTLGLQQHDGNGSCLSYPSTTVAVDPPSQGSLFFGREPMQFAVEDGDGQHISLPYRNLMETQLLHDFAG